MDNKMEYSKLLAECIGEGKAKFIQQEVENLKEALSNCDYRWILSLYEDIGFQTIDVMNQSKNTKDKGKAKLLHKGFNELRNIHSDAQMMIIEGLQDICSCKPQVGGRNIIPPNLN